MADTPETSPEKPKKKIITVGVTEGSNSGGGSEERRGGKGRRSGGGRGRDERDRPPAVPPALMRGPRPKPKAEAVPEELPAEPADEAVTDEAGAEPAADATEVSPAATEPEAEAPSA